MHINKLLIIILSLLLFTGCSKGAAPSLDAGTSPVSASPSGVISETGTEGLSASPEPSSSPEPTSDASQWLKNPGDIDTFAFGEIEKVFLNNCYNGLSVGSPYIESILNKMVDKNALQHFSAIITNVRENDDATFTLTIEKVKINPKYEPGAQNTEPYLTDKSPSETVKVSSDVYLVLNTVVQIQMDDKLNEYIKPAEAHYFDFYSSGGDILFIIEGVMP
jgi:hypothetical protein